MPRIMKLIRLGLDSTGWQKSFPHTLVVRCLQTTFLHGHWLIGSSPGQEVTCHVVEDIYPGRGTTGLGLHKYCIHTPNID